MKYENSSEQELIRAVLEGDKEAFDRLLRPYIRPMYGISYRMLNSEEDAKDVCQESMIKIYKHLASFQAESKFFTWVYRITVNCAKDLIKKCYREESLSLEEELEDAGEGLWNRSERKAETPEASLQRRELYEEIMETLMQLPTDLRSAIVLRDVEGFSYAEISEILESNINTVKSKVSRARKLAIKSLTAKGIAPGSYEKEHLYE